MRAIDGDHLKQWIIDRGLNGGLCHPADIIDQIDREFTIQPERTGKWIEYDNSHCECPFCHEEWSYFDNEVEYFNYCPNCGARMEP